jgi:hypothetical protein
MTNYIKYYINVPLSLFQKVTFTKQSNDDIQIDSLEHLNYIELSRAISSTNSTISEDFIKTIFYNKSNIKYTIDKELNQLYNDALSSILIDCIYSISTYQTRNFNGTFNIDSVPFQTPTTIPFIEDDEIHITGSIIGSITYWYTVVLKLSNSVPIENHGQPVTFQRLSGNPNVTITDAKYKNATVTPPPYYQNVYIPDTVNGVEVVMDTSKNNYPNLSFLN